MNVCWEQNALEGEAGLYRLPTFVFIWDNPPLKDKMNQQRHNAATLGRANATLLVVHLLGRIYSKSKLNLL